MTNEPLSDEELSQLLHLCRRIRDGYPRKPGKHYRAQQSAHQLHEWGVTQFSDYEPAPIWEKGDGNMFDSYAPKTGPTDVLECM